MGKVNNDIVLITGGSGCIGRSIIENLIEEGVHLVISVDKNRSNFSHEKFLEINIDITDKDLLSHKVKEIIEKYGRIDILINNVGIVADELFVKMSYENFEKVINVNLNSVFYITKLVAKNMIKNKKGSIVNISSIAGIFGNVGQINYSASKAGVIAMTKTMSKELGKKGIRVNCVAPGIIRSNMTSNLNKEYVDDLISRTSLNRIGEASEVAKVVTFLASDDASYLTGEIISISGGLTI